MRPKLELSREALLDDRIREFWRGQPDRASLVSKEAMARSLERMLECGPPRDQVWVFGYGSLMWNPAFHFEARRRARIHGYHRRFCLWTKLGRGCPENPGLMLGLEAGGSCGGVAYKVAAEAVRTELEIVWRREMLTASYRPVWLNAHTEQGPVRAVTFVINRSHERYAGKLDEATIVRHIATASGPIGRCCDYLYETVRHLEELTLTDHRMTALASAVRAAQGATTNEA